jgi:cyclopropane-fatty-acyl-phospholipid synthase
VPLQLPTSYFLLCLGKHLKYSSCLWPSKDSTLDKAEEAMLGAQSIRSAITAVHSCDGILQASIL